MVNQLIHKLRPNYKWDFMENEKDFLEEVFWYYQGIIEYHERFQPNNPIPALSDFHEEEQFGEWADDEYCLDKYGTKTIYAYPNEEEEMETMMEDLQENYAVFFKDVILVLEHNHISFINNDDDLINSPIGKVW